MQETIQQFEETGDISLLLNANSPLDSDDTLRSKLWPADDYKCYQESMAKLLDKFYPEIVTYILYVYDKKEDFCGKQHYEKSLIYLIDMFNQKIHTEASKDWTEFFSSRGVNIKNEASDSSVSKMATAVETEIDENGFLLIQGSLHCELYVIGEDQGRRYIIREGLKDMDKGRWELGCFDIKKCSSFPYGAMNHNILFKLLGKDMPFALSGPRKFTSRAEFEQALYEIDLREMVREATTRQY